MILEAAILTVRPERDAAFAAALVQAQPLIAASPGFRGMEVRPCVEQSHRYLLLVVATACRSHGRLSQIGALPGLEGTPSLFLRSLPNS